MLANVFIMGKGFSILVWDSFGGGLVMVNPRILGDGTLDLYGNPNNWWSYNTDLDKEEKINKLTKGIKHFLIID